ncbi:MAG: hypothetical protein BWY50_02116 [Spirochaetes bacterium ADurb.Bin315]|nr:MAG: hypothetical protein BWY50_02116 [Spirochaetes bacterium ADurb.Bin315]
MPTIPISLMVATSSASERVLQSTAGASPSGCSLSGVMTKASQTMLLARVTRRISLTTPLTGACTSALMNPLASPIFSPLTTVSPFAFKAFAGEPRCCDSATTNSPGRGSRSIGCMRLNTFLSSGCTPPFLNVGTLCINERSLLGNYQTKTVKKYKDCSIIQESCYNENHESHF